MRLQKNIIWIWCVLLLLWRSFDGSQCNGGITQSLHIRTRKILTKTLFIMSVIKEPYLLLISKKLRRANWPIGLWVPTPLIPINT